MQGIKLSVVRKISVEFYEQDFETREEYDEFIKKCQEDKDFAWEQFYDNAVEFQLAYIIRDGSDEMAEKDEPKIELIEAE